MLRVEYDTIGQKHIYLQYVYLAVPSALHIRGDGPYGEEHHCNRLGGIRTRQQGQNHSLRNKNTVTISTLFENLD